MSVLTCDSDYVDPYVGQTGCTTRIEVAGMEDVGQTSRFDVNGPFCCLIAEVRTGGRLFVLRDPIVTGLEKADDLWTCENDRFHLLGYGPTIQDAVQALMDDFAVTYDGLTQVDDQLLTLDAQKAKRSLGELVSAVTGGAR